MMPPSSKGKSRLLQVARVWRLLLQPQLERIELSLLRIGQHPPKHWSEHHSAERVDDGLAGSGC
jgi:hypothetical protein